MNVRLRMYQILLFKFRRHLCKGSMNWLTLSLGYLIYHLHGPLSLNYGSKLTFLQFIRMGGTGSVTNFRGISLLSVVGKCQERILHTVLYDQVFQYLHDSHHGFLRGRSTVSQLVLVHDDWAKVLDNQGQVDVVFLDFSKAFDLVNHSLLIRKLNQYSVGGQLLER